MKTTAVESALKTRVKTTAVESALKTRMKTTAVKPALKTRMKTTAVKPRMVRKATRERTPVEAARMKSFETAERASGKRVMKAAMKVRPKTVMKAFVESGVETGTAVLRFRLIRTKNDHAYQCGRENGNYRSKHDCTPPKKGKVFVHVVPSLALLTK